MNFNGLKLKYKGFSFVEISIVCFIMLILLIPIFTLMSRGSSVTVRNRNEILAQQYASNVIAYCNALPFNDRFINYEEGVTTKEIEGMLIKDIPGQENISIDLPVELGENASKTMTVINYDRTDNWPYRCKLITVKVEWLQSGETKTRNVTMTGLVRE